MQSSVGAAVAVTLLAIAAAPPASALRMALPMELALVAPPPTPFPGNGALVVTWRPATAGRGNTEPAAIRLTSSAGVSIPLQREELAPSLVRLAPRRPLAPGRYSVRGVGAQPTTLVVGAAAPELAAPDVVSVVRARDTIATPLGETAEVERVTVTLRSVPAEAAAIVARWVDWHDDQGGLYGAWTTLPAGVTRVELICTAEADCRDVNGHIPRPRERGELRFLDRAGRLSAPAPPVVVD